MQKLEHPLQVLRWYLKIFSCLNSLSKQNSDPAWTFSHDHAVEIPWGQQILSVTLLVLWRTSE